MKLVNGIQGCCWPIPCAEDVQAEVGLFILTLVEDGIQFLSKSSMVQSDDDSCAVVDSTARPKLL